MNLGKMIGLSPQHLIIRAKGPYNKDNLPDIGEAVYTIENERIGKIMDIFGPVVKPFISIKVNSSISMEELENQKGNSYYTLKKKNQKTKSVKSGSPKPRRTSRRPRSHGR